MPVKPAKQLSGEVFYPSAETVQQARLKDSVVAMKIHFHHQA